VAAVLFIIDTPFWYEFAAPVAEMVVLISGHVVAADSWTLPHVRFPLAAIPVANWLAAQSVGSAASAVAVAALPVTLAGCAHAAVPLALMPLAN
jgi:hypothetical protein